MTDQGIYRSSLSLLTDFYELTMAYGYWKLGIKDKPAVFNLFFRRRPFEGTYAIAAGLDSIIDFIERFHFDSSDLAYLESLKTDRNQPLFEPAFLEYLSSFSFSCDIDAMKEGTPVFPYEPMVRVQGPILEAQLLEGPLLNIMNFQTLIATKASRICAAAEGDEVVEFGLRRAQGIDGALSGSRAAYIGGCNSTSNVLAGKHFGIPVKGTHAHSWIMAFKEEEEAFDSYAAIMPHNCMYLIDTFDTIEGGKKAIQVAKKWEKKGYKILGVRLDSGDLADLSITVREMLDSAGFQDAKIMASNELDERIIRDLKKQGAKINIWGVGTHLITGKDQPALDGVYKLTAIEDEAGKWIYKLKISEQIVKTTNPGIIQVRRYSDDQGRYIGDMMYDTLLGIPKSINLIDPIDPTKKKNISSQKNFKDLLIPIFRKGKKVYNSPLLTEMRQNTLSELNLFDPTIRRFLNPKNYFVGLEKSLYDLKESLINEIKNKNSL